MPADLEIEREQNINGSMAAYAEQLLISTGRNNWTSRIEDEKEGVFLRQVKALVGPRGKYSDPYHNVMLTNSSFMPTTRDEPQYSADASSSASAFLLPSFQYVPTISTDPAEVEAFVKAYVLPSRPLGSNLQSKKLEEDVISQVPDLQRRFPGSRKVDEILVLICGHGGRDVRCGTLGPILQKEFEEKLQRQNVTILREAPVTAARLVNHDLEQYTPTARVGLISHIGGHKWAGNVIIYIPPSFKTNALAGKGIWYGRVAPEHVEGIISKTIMEGKVIRDLFRGGIDQKRQIIRL